jgi:hypothetical protein
MPLQQKPKKQHLKQNKEGIETRVKHAHIDNRAQARDGVGVVEAREEAECGLLVFDLVSQWGQGESDASAAN